MNRVVAAQESSAVQATVNILNNARDSVRVEAPNDIKVNDKTDPLTSTAPPNVGSKPALIPSNDLLDQIKIVE